MVWRKGQSGNQAGRPFPESSIAREAAEAILRISKKLPKELQLYALAVANPIWFHEKIYPLVFRLSSANGPVIDKSRHLNVTINELPTNERILIKEVIAARIAAMRRDIATTAEPLQIGGPRPDLEPQEQGQASSSQQVVEAEVVVTNHARAGECQEQASQTDAGQAEPEPPRTGNTQAASDETDPDPRT